MKKKKQLLVVILILTALVLGACTRSASQAPASADAGTDAQSQLEAILNAAATQTAEAAALGPEAGGGALETAVPTETPAASGELATATPTPQVVVQDIDLDIPDRYTLREGEFPYCIARRFDINATDLLAVNGLSPNGLFQPGLTLTIPKNSGGFDGARALRAHPTTYTVGGDDTFYSIACRFGDVWPEEIAAANNTKVDANLNSGDTIQIP